MNLFKDVRGDDLDGAVARFLAELPAETPPRP
jgi:hypothetical protein